MKALKMLHVVAGMDPEMGGVCKAVQMIVTGLDDFDVKSEIVSLDDPHAKYLKDLPLLIHPVGVGKTPWRYNSRLATWLHANLQAFDIVIVHGLWLYTSYAVREVNKSILQKNKKAPAMFVMPHGMLDPYFQTAPGRKIKAIRNWVFWKLVERKIIHDASGLLFTCEMEKILARRTFKPYQPKTELVVGLGVDAPPMYTTAMSDVFTSKSGLEKNRPYLLYISRIHEKKGIDLLVTSYLNLEQEKIPLPALVIAGPGRETAYGEKIQLIASKSQNIVFTGMLAGAAKWGAFYGCQAFILPSHQENFGIAVVEAMTCGKPVLISNQINIWKEIIDFGAGLVAQDTEAGCRELLEKWMALLPEEKEQMGECAKLCYQKKFSIHAASQHLLQAVSSH